MNYQELRGMIHGKRVSKKLGNNTYAEIRDAETIAVKLHQTDVLTFKANGDVTLNSGGWRTVTTKARMNAYLRPYGIYQEKGNWYIGHYSGEPEYKHTRLGVYQDGLTIHKDGTIAGMLPIIPKMAGVDRNLKRKIKQYCVDFVNALDAGQVQPSNGDCFYCAMREEKSNRPLGEVAKSDHISEHIKEGYFVFSLLGRALEMVGASIAMRSYVGLAIDESSDKNVFGLDFVKAQIEKALYRYICRQYGYAA